jgi:hypothetical protein
MNDHLRAYRGYGPVAYVANLLFLATLPVAILLALTGRWPLGLIVFLVGTPVLWAIRNRAVAGTKAESLGRRRLPLEPPEAMSELVTLPDARMLRDRRAAKERADFLRAVLARYNNESYAPASAPRIRELVAYLPPNRHPPQTLRTIALQSAILGFAVADEERARGWERRWFVDAVVDTAIAWDLHNGAVEAHKDWITGTFAMYALNAGYYLARQGDEGWDAIVSGIAPLALSIAEEQARGSTPGDT